MVRAATKKINSSGIQLKSGRTSASPRAKKGSTQKKVKSVTAKKVPKKIMAMGEPK
jgi:hypothetical protein